MAGGWGEIQRERWRVGGERDRWLVVVGRDIEKGGGWVWEET